MIAFRTTANIHQQLETLLQMLQATVRAIRNARAEYGVDLGRRIPATVLIADTALR